MNFLLHMKNNSLKLSEMGLPFLAPLLAMTLMSIPNASAEGTVRTVWKASLPARPLKSWSVSELRKLQTSSSREKNSTTGQVSLWKGPLMSLVVEKTIESLPAPDKAQVDLVILKSSAGDQAQIPRWMLTKYPVLLAAQNDHVQLILPQLILPWSSKPKIWEEGLPLNRYQLKDVVEIEFASYHEAYGSLYLKRRTDPLALRGEKLFVQNCTSCHSVGIEKTARKIASSGHPSTQDAPKLKERDMKALFSYIEAFRAENPGTGNGASISGNPAFLRSAQGAAPKAQQVSVAN